MKDADQIDMSMCVYVREGGRNLFSFQNVLEDLFAVDECDLRNYWFLQQTCRNILLTCFMKELLFGCPLGIFTWSQWHIFEYKFTLSGAFNMFFCNFVKDLLLILKVIALLCLSSLILTSLPWLPDTVIIRTKFPLDFLTLPTYFSTTFIWFLLFFRSSVIKSFFVVVVALNLIFLTSAP